VLDFFEHGEREVETVCLVIFPLISLMGDEVSSLNRKGVKAVVFGPEGSDTEIKDGFDGKYNLVFTKAVCFQVGNGRWLLNRVWQLNRGWCTSNIFSLSGYKFRSEHGVNELTPCSLRNL